VASHYWKIKTVVSASNLRFSKEPKNASHLATMGRKIKSYFSALLAHTAAVYSEATCAAYYACIFIWNENVLFRYAQSKLHDLAFNMHLAFV